MALVRFPRHRNTASVLKWREPAGGLGSLSERERGVLALLVKGLTNREIAEELGVSTETVKKHISQALSKTTSKTRTRPLRPHRPRIS